MCRRSPAPQVSEGWRKPRAPCQDGSHTGRLPVALTVVARAELPWTPWWKPPGSRQMQHSSRLPERPRPPWGARRGVGGWLCARGRSAGSSVEKGVFCYHSTLGPENAGCPSLLIISGLRKLTHVTANHIEWKGVRPVYVQTGLWGTLRGRRGLGWGPRNPVGSQGAAMGSWEPRGVTGAWGG